MHILHAKQFTPALIQEILADTSRIQREFARPSSRTRLKRTLAGELLFNVFYEPSTRTRMSFASAAHHLGMTVVETENAKLFSSAVKGETLADTIRVLETYHPSAIVIRHHVENELHQVAQLSNIPIINAGDGGGQHPTQALLDLYTIWKKVGRLSRIRVMMCGDLKNGRTVRSLTYLLAMYPGVEFVFFSPSLPMREDIKEHLSENGVSFIEANDNIEQYIPTCDVIYTTRLQVERHPITRTPNPRNPREDTHFYAITPERMALAKQQCIVMHPLPRNDEISVDVDNDPRCVYFDQAGFGMFVRMALLNRVINNK